MIFMFKIHASEKVANAKQHRGRCRVTAYVHSAVDALIWTITSTTTCTEVNL